MRITNKEDFLKKGTKAIEEIFNMLTKLPVLNIGALKPKNTVLVIVDMINGFVREGALKSPRAEALIPDIVKLSKACSELGINKIAFADNHTSSSPEFESYPAHCMTGTSEAEVVNEIKEIGGYKLIPKNSTNGFLEEEFQQWLEQNTQVDTFIVAGVCTDICVQQFAITLKAFFNMRNKKGRVIVPLNAVDTYDLAVHNGDFMNVMSLYSMIGSGIEAVKEIEL